MITRPATRDDILEMTGQTFPESIRAISAVDDGKLLGIAGVRDSSPRMCFANIHPELKHSPKTIVRMARWVVNVMNNMSTPVYAVADEDEPTAFRFLEHTGFKWISSTDQGEVFQWHQQ
tara:strand:- start:3094 stop:3450 length:357 start_codon:yes stop_codon:yes gene_type:complete